jgi:hypothetical protein
MLFVVFPLNFSALVMVLIFVVLISGTGVAFWKMLTDPTGEPAPKMTAVKVKKDPSPRIGRPVQHNA